MRLYSKLWLVTRRRASDTDRTLELEGNKCELNELFGCLYFSGIPIKMCKYYFSSYNVQFSNAHKPAFHMNYPSWFLYKIFTEIDYCFGY